MRITTSILATLFLASAIGCASYYQIDDPSTGRSYYTKKFSRNKSGAVVFKDTGSGKQVTLPSSEIQKVDKDVYQSGVANTR